MDLNKVCYFLITGASKGIGKTFAIECCRNFKPGSLVVLMARSKDGLEETKKEILAINDKIIVRIYPIDLSEKSANEFRNIIVNSLTDHSVNDFELAFIIHNAATIGDVSKRAREFDDPTVWDKYFHLNLFSVSTLNSVFMHHFESINKLVVNITSKCATSPFKSFTLYCSGKAARQLYFQVLAEEEPGTMVLNYSPGPVDTDMVSEIVSKTVDNDIKGFFVDGKKTGAILQPMQTVTKFLEVLSKGKFKSGANVDYYD